MRLCRKSICNTSPNDPAIETHCHLHSSVFSRSLPTFPALCNNSMNDFSAHFQFIQFLFVSTAMTHKITITSCSNIITWPLEVTQLTKVMYSHIEQSSARDFWATVCKTVRTVAIGPLLARLQTWRALIFSRVCLSVCVSVSVCLWPALLPFNVNRFWRNLVTRTLLWSSLAATIKVQIGHRGTSRRLFEN